MHIDDAYNKFSDLLADALEDEHCHAECGAACDIHFAWENGYTLWAAHLLQGATECPKTDAIVSAILAWAEIGTNDAAWQRFLDKQRDDMVTHDHWTCGKCTAVNWSGDYTAGCAACGENECSDAMEGEWEHACGDVDPWDHTGGYVDLDTGTFVHIDPVELDEDKENVSENVSKRQWYVHTLDVNGGVGEVEDYDLKGAAEYCGLFDIADEEIARDPVEYLKAPFRVDLDTLSDEDRERNIMRRVGTFETIASYSGWSAVTSGCDDDLTLSKREILARWKLPA